MSETKKGSIGETAENQEINAFLVYPGDTKIDIMKKNLRLRIKGFVDKITGKNKNNKENKEESEEKFSINNTFSGDLISIKTENGGEYQFKVLSNYTNTINNKWAGVSIGLVGSDISGVFISEFIKKGKLTPLENSKLKLELGKVESVSVIKEKDQ